MFTGLVMHVGTVAGVQPGNGGVRLSINADGWTHAPSTGDSIAVNGCCLTLAAPADAGILAFDAVPETLRKTTIGGLSIGSRVNLEHAATASTLLGGHVVQGHVDGVGKVLSAGPVAGPEDWRVRISPPPALMEFMIPRGSVAVEGVSLTLAVVDPAAAWFEVALIPETLRRTTLAALRPGDGVNIEADAMAKTVVHWLRHYRAAGGGGAV